LIARREFERSQVKGNIKRAFWYRPRSAVVAADGAVTEWRDATKHGRHLVSIGGSDAEVAPSRRAGHRAIHFDHTGLQSAKPLRLGNRFDIIAVLRFDGDPHHPANRWGASTAFMINSPGKTPSDPYGHGTSGGIGVAVTDGHIKMIAEGKEWSLGGVEINRGEKYIVRIRRRSAKDFSLFVGPPEIDEDTGRIKPADTLKSEVIEPKPVHLKIGASDALYYAWEGAVFEVIGFNGLMSPEHVKQNYFYLQKKYDI